MSKYTTEVRFICETMAGYTSSVGYNDIDTVLEKSWNKVFDFNFPIFDESYRKPLCQKILRHYYTHEICEETVGLWKLRLYARMLDIMPYYNKLYESALLEFDPLKDIDVTTSHKRSNNDSSNRTTAGTVKLTTDRTTTDSSSLTGTGSSNITGNSSSEQRSEETSKYSDTPQGSIQNLVNDTYLTNATIKQGSSEDSSEQSQTGSTTSEQSSTSTSKVGGSDSTDASENVTESATRNEEYTTNVSGKSSGAVSYSKLLMEYRDSILNIDLMLINDLSNLFFLLW